MILNPDWLKPKEKPYFHQISLDCIEEIAVCMEGIDIEEIDCDTCLIMQEILSDEIDDSEFLKFAIEDFSEMMGFAFFVGDYFLTCYNISCYVKYNTP